MDKNVYTHIPAEPVSRCKIVAPNGMVLEGEIRTGHNYGTTDKSDWYIEMIVDTVNGKKQHEAPGWMQEYFGYAYIKEQIDRARSVEILSKEAQS